MMHKLLVLFLLSLSLGASEPDKYLNYQKALSGMSVGDDDSDTLRLELLDKARQEPSGISRQDYQFLKGTSALAASRARHAHTQGILGADVRILLLEDSGITHGIIKDYVEPGSPKDPSIGFTELQDHGSGMASLIRSIAPFASIFVKPIEGYQNNLDSVRIINASFGEDNPESFKKRFKDISGRNDILVVKSAGNHTENLSEHQAMTNSADIIPISIFAGNLRQDYKRKTASGFPGDMKEFQESFLWVIADDVLTASGPKNSTQYSPTSGTSGAAAIVSGAAALILSKYPGLTTKELKEILLESADRDIFQIFGSGYNAVHLEDPMLKIIQKKRQYKKLNPYNSNLDFAEHLAKLGDCESALEIITAGNGVGGINPKPITLAERAQYERILGVLASNGITPDDIEKLPLRVGDELELKHRKNLVDLAKTMPLGGAGKKTAGYDPAFWGKGVLNIKNALLYAQLKVRYPTLKPAELRETMLEFLNADQQYAARKIENRFRKKHDPSKKITDAEIEARKSITINQSLPGRVFDKAPGTAPKASPADESDADILNTLRTAFPDVPGRRNMKVISDTPKNSDTPNNTDGAKAASSTGSKITPIAETDIPIGAPPALVKFLKSDHENLLDNLDNLYNEWLKSLIDMEPDAFANEILRKFPKLLQPFKANRVINLERVNDEMLREGILYKTEKYHNVYITIIDLLHDAVVDQNVRTAGTVENAKIFNLAMGLFNKLKAENQLSPQLKSGILSILDQFKESADLSSFIVDNDLLDVNFISLRWKRLENRCGTDFIGAYHFPDFLKTASPSQKAKIKDFLAIPANAEFSAQIANSIFGEYFWAEPKNSSLDLKNQFQAALDAILADIEKKAPDFCNFIKEYARTNPNFIGALKEQAQVTFSDTSDVKEAMAQQLADAVSGI